MLTYSDETQLLRLEDASPDVTKVADDVTIIADPPRRPAAPAFAAATIAYGLVLASTVAVTTRSAGGRFTYALDDPLIHLTMARNLAEHGSFGIVPGAYESASSAPAWTAALALPMRITPDGWWWPLVLNVVAAIWLLHRLAGIVTTSLPGRGTRLATAVALPIGLGLVPLTFTGMEHTLHAALVVAIVLGARRRPPEGLTRAGLAGLAGLVAVATLVRFETGFVAAGVAVALVLSATVAGRRRAVGQAVVVLAATAVPVAAFAAFNRAQGQGWLPNSVMAKSQATGGALPSPVAALEKLVSDPLLLVLVLLAGLVLAAWVRLPQARAGGRFVPAATAPLVALLVAAGLHVLLADVGWFERYQAYLVIALAASLLLTAPAVLPPARPVRLVALAVVLLAVLRVPLLVHTPLATYDIHENQSQLGGFLAEAYDGRAVAVNDIGYVGWLHRGDVVDVAGLGSHDVLAASKAGELDAAFFDRLAEDRDVEVLAVFDEFFRGLAPEGWSRAGRWCTTDRRMVLSSDCVAFYAPDGEPLARLSTELDRYAPRLPEGMVHRQG